MRNSQKQEKEAKPKGQKKNAGKSFRDAPEQPTASSGIPASKNQPQEGQVQPPGKDVEPSASQKLGFPPRDPLAEGFLSHGTSADQASGNHTEACKSSPVDPTLLAPAQNPQQQYLSDENTSKLAQKIGSNSDRKNPEGAEDQEPAPAEGTQPDPHSTQPLPQHPETGGAA